MSSASASQSEPDPEPDAGEPGPSASATSAAPDAAPTQSAAQPDASAPSPTQAFHVVVLGASTCNGKNADVEMYGGTPGAQAWPDLYEAWLIGQRPGSDLVKMCVNSTGTYQAMPTGFTPPTDRPAPDPTNNITAALALAPDGVIVSYPSGGDLKNGYTVAELMSNMEAIRDTAEAAGVAVWFSSPNPVGPTYADGSSFTGAEVNTLLIDLKEAMELEFGDRFLDFWTPRVTPNTTDAEAYANPAYILNEDNHPNAAGQELLFQVVRDAGLPEVAFSN